MGRNCTFYCVRHILKLLIIGIQPIRRLWQKDPKCKDVNKDESQYCKAWADGVMVNITTFDLVLAVEMKVRILLCAILCYVKERYFLTHLLRFACSFTGRPGPEQTVQQTNLSENWVDSVTVSLFQYYSTWMFLSIHYCVKWHLKLLV